MAKCRSERDVLVEMMTARENLDRAMEKLEDRGIDGYGEVRDLLLAVETNIDRSYIGLVAIGGSDGARYVRHKQA